MSGPNSGLIFLSGIGIAATIVCAIEAETLNNKLLAEQRKVQVLTEICAVKEAPHEPGKMLSYICPLTEITYD